MNKANDKNVNKDNELQGSVNGKDESQLIPLVVKWMIAGNSRSEIVDLIRCHTERKITDVEINNLLQRARESIAQSASTIAEETMTVHLVLYEKLYKYFHSIGCVDGANRTMLQKERLVKMGASDTISIDRKTQITINNRYNNYDENKLSDNERFRLSTYIKKIEK